MDNNILLQITIPSSLQKEERILEYLLQNNAVITSRNGLKKAFKKNRILLQNIPLKGNEWVQPNQVISIIAEEETPPKIYPLNLKVIFEDDDMAVIYKPAGEVVSGNQFKTIENALLHNLKESPLIDAMLWPKPCHRLDAPTSGLLLIAKTRLARVKLGQQFETKEIKKKYHAIAMGQLNEKEGDIHLDLEGKSCHSSFKVIDEIPSLKSGILSLVELEPHTGRTHQLRKHLAMIGHPIVGDNEYGEEGNTLKGKGLFLSSTSVSFLHPRTLEKLSFTIDIPSKFISLFDREKKMWNKYRG